MSPSFRPNRPWWAPPSAKTTAAATQSGRATTNKGATSARRRFGSGLVALVLACCLAWIAFSDRRLRTHDRVTSPHRRDVQEQLLRELLLSPSTQSSGAAPKDGGEEREGKARTTTVRKDGGAVVPTGIHLNSNNSNKEEEEKEEELLKDGLHRLRDAGTGQQPQPHHRPERGAVNATAFSGTPGAFSTSSSSSSSSSSSDYAYAFLMSGCDPDDGVANYRYMLYGVLVAVRSLQNRGSLADYHLLVEMYSNAAASRLPPREEEWLSRLEVRVHYLPKRQQQYFYRTQMDKFRILRLYRPVFNGANATGPDGPRNPTQRELYRRVMFLDVDVLPSNNLDYLFHLSDPLHTESPTILAENVIFEDVGGPACGGTFMLTPHEGDLEEIQRIITRKEQQPEFDTAIGWGHVIQESEAWTQPSKMKRSTKWNFYAAPGDQGLLLYWTMYYKKNVSMIFRSSKGVVKNYGPSPDGRDLTVVTSRLMNPFGSLSKHPATSSSNTSQQRQYSIPMPDGCWKDCRVHPWMDFHHFIASTKPWVAGLPPVFDAKRHRTITPAHYWYAVLSELNDELRMGINFKQTFPNRMGQPPVHRNPGFAKSRNQLADLPLTNLLEE